MPFMGCLSPDSILRWNYCHGALMLALAALSMVLREPFWMVLGASLSLLVYIYLGRNVVSNMPLWLGKANMLTIGRFLAVSAVVLAAPHLPFYVVSIVFLICVCLDGFDGYLARKYAEVSEFGQYLDMEVDAYAICAMALLLTIYHDLTPWIMVLGTLRYSYALLVRLTVRTQKLEPKRQYASVIAVLFYLALNLCLTFASSITTVVLLICSLLLVGSFARSYLFQITRLRSP